MRKAFVPKKSLFFLAILNQNKKYSRNMRKLIRFILKAPLTLTLIFNVVLFDLETKQLAALSCTELLMVSLNIIIPGTHEQTFRMMYEYD